MQVIADQLAALGAKTADHDLAAKVNSLNQSWTGSGQQCGAGFTISDHGAAFDPFGSGGYQIWRLKTAPRDAIVNRRVGDAVVAKDSYLCARNLPQ